MQRTFSFDGGSQGDRASNSNGLLGCFQRNVRSVYPSDKKVNRRYRILPAFDKNLSVQDTAFPTSTAPYRLVGSQVLDKDTQTEAFTGWYLSALGYSMLGRSGEDFLSPQMLAAQGFSATESADPVQDCRNLAKATPHWAHLTERTKEPGGRDKGALLPYVSTNVLLNVLESERPQDPSSWRNSILTMRETSLRELKKVLSWPTSAGARILDPQWPQYCYGDVTGAHTGCVAWMEKRQVGTVQTWCIIFGAREFQNVDAIQLPITEEHLRNRHHLGSSDTLKFLSYQEIVDWMLSDGAFPRELVAQACSHAANIPAGQGPSYGAATTGGNYAPATQQAGPSHNPMAPPLRAPQDNIDMSASAKAPDVKFWVMAHGAVQPAPVPLSEIRNWSPELLSGVKMMDEAQRTPWSDPAVFGIAVAPPTPPAPVYAPPPAPTYVAPPAAPVYTPPPAPTYVAPAAPVYVAPAAPVYTPPPAAPAPAYAPPAPAAPTASSLSPEEAAELAALRHQSTANVAGMSPGDFVRLSILAARSGG